MTVARSRPIAPGTVLLACISFFSPSPASAQASRALDVGSRVRVRLEGSTFPLVGVVAELRPDTLLLSLPSPPARHVRTLPVRDIAELNISGGQRRYAALGVALGALTGVVATVAYNGVVQTQCFGSCPDPISVGLGAAIGGITLGGAFYFIRTERWLPVALPDRRRQR
jgi:hypothetical protein